MQKMKNDEKQKLKQLPGLNHRVCCRCVHLLVRRSNCLDSIHGRRTIPDPIRKQSTQLLSSTATSTKSHHRVAQKRPTEQNAISRQLIDFLPKFQDLQGEGSFDSPWKFHQNIFVAARITAVRIFILYFKIMPKIVTCNVLCC